MKTNFKSGPVLNVILVIILSIIAFQIYSAVFVKSGLKRKQYDSYTISHIPQPIDSIVSDEVSHKEYTELTDNIKKLRKLKNGEWLQGSGVHFGYVIGTTSAQLCNSCTLNNLSLDKGIVQNYITLPGWRLKNRSESLTSLEPIKFFVKNGQSYIRKPVEILVKKKATGGHYRVQFVDEPVKFRYNTSNDYLMIPVSANVKILVGIIGGICSLAFAFYALYLLWNFALFIIDLSKGLSFTENNIRRLKFISIGLIGIPIVIFLLILLMRVIFINYFTNDLVLNEKTYSNSWQSLAVGVVFLLLFKAFTQGKALKEENDLTV